MPTFTVLIGSAGRSTLERSLESIARQHRPTAGDQTVVVFDTFERTEDWLIEQIRRVEAFGKGFQATGYDAGLHHLGVPQINHALAEVPLSGSHILTIGDDDVFVDAAYERMRDACEDAPGRAVLWKFLAPWRELLWEHRTMTMSRISGCCIAAPRAHVGQMPLRNAAGELYPEHDFDWMQAVIQASGHEPVWLDAVLVIARPDARGDDVTHKGIIRCWACRKWRFVEDVDMLDAHCPTCGVVIPVHEMTGAAAKCQNV